MRRFVLAAVVIVPVALCAADGVPKPVVPPAPATAELSHGAITTTVYRLKNIAAADAASVLGTQLQKQFQKQDLDRQIDRVISRLPVVIVAEPVTNSLRVSAESAYADEIARLLQEFDRTPDQVVLKTSIRMKAADGTMKILSRPQIRTLVKQPAMVQIGLEDGSTLEIEVIADVIHGEQGD